MSNNDALRNAVADVLCIASNFPEAVQVRLLGQDMQPLIDKTTGAILTKFLAAHDADVRKAALEEAAQIAEQDLCALVGCGNPKCTQSRATAAAIRAAALGDAPTPKTKPLEHEKSRFGIYHSGPLGAALRGGE